MSVEVLRATSLQQTQQLIEGLSKHFELLSPVEQEARAGFVAVKADRAQEWVSALRSRGVFVDARGRSLRFGPAPYLRPSDLEEALSIVGELASSLT